MHIRFLKVKIKSLAAEARIIRLEEARSRGDLREGLYLHRILQVRREARATHLAYGYLRGRGYAALEHSCHEAPPLKNVARMVAKYGNTLTEKDALDVLKVWAEREVVLDALPKAAYAVHGQAVNVTP